MNRHLVWFLQLLVVVVVVVLVVVVVMMVLPLWGYQQVTDTANRSKSTSMKRAERS